MARRKRKGDYDVGYGKPPRSGQFKPGQSGNPRGRPKKRSASAEQIAEVLYGKVTVTEGGKRRTVTTLEAFTRRLLQGALKGDSRASANVLKLLPMLERAGAQQGADAAAMAEAEAPSDAPDEELLKFFAQRILAEDPGDNEEGEEGEGGEGGRGGRGGMNKMSPDAARQAEAAFCRRSLYAFTWKVFNTLHPVATETFIQTWHVEAMCHALEEVRQGANRRLVITVPPRHLKSITTAVAYPAFLLGHDPSAKIIVANYGLDLARKHAADFTQILAAAWYRRTFPGTQLTRRGGRPEDIRTTAGGGRKAVSIGSPVTGFGADYIIIDDLLKAGDAASEAERERAKTYIDASLLSRFNDPAKGGVVAIQQRLHEDDPAGYLLAKGTYRHLNLPAIATDDEDIPVGPGRFHRRRKGEALFPQRLDHDVLETRRQEMGSATFNMQYQQDPIAADGSALRWEWFGTYDTPQPRTHFQYVIQSWDTGMSSNPASDPSVCTTWGFREGLWYLLDIVRERLDYPDLKKRVLALAAEWTPEKVLIEKAATGGPLLHDLRPDNRSLYQPVKPTEDKEVRFNAATARVEEGCLVLPAEAPWLDGFRKELLGFPKSKHDDQVDSFSQFVNWAFGNGFWRLLPRDSPHRPARMRERPEGRRRR